MVTQRILGSLRLWRSWIALGSLALLALLAWMVQQNRASSAQDGLVVKTYPCPAGQAPAIADRLRQELGSADGVRVAADARTSQIVVQAPQEMQAWVAKRLTAGADVKNAESDAQTGSVHTRIISLQRARTEQIDSSLTNLLGERLTSLPAPHDLTKAYRMALSGGNIEVTLDFSASQVKLAGTGPAIDAATRLIQILDSPAESSREVRLLPLRTDHMDDVRRATAAIQSISTKGSGPRSSLAFYQVKTPDNGPAVAAPGQPGAVPGQPVAPPANPAAPPVAPPGPGTPAAPNEGVHSGLVNPVQIEMLEGLDVLVLRGNAQDIAQVAEIIKQVEELSALTRPEIRFIPIKQVDCEALAVLLRNLYDEIFLARQGRVSITPIVTPNEILVIGRPENVKTVAGLIEKLDLPQIPDAQFRVFHLRYASSTAAQASITSFFTDRGGLSPVVRATADARSNALIVQASPRDMAQVEELIGRIDTMNSDSVNEVRIIRLEHALAPDVANIMQSAIGSTTGAAAPAQPGAAPGAPGAAPTPAATAATASQRAAMLRFLTVDAKGRRLLNSGILSDIKITTDAKANALVVTAPAEDMELIEALVHQIDLIPAAEAQIKVFTIVNGDASNLADMLRSLFGLPTSQGATGGFGGGAAAQAIQMTTAGGENTVVSLRFAVDVRTNSIIATGTMGDLNVVEAILTKLDDNDVRKRHTVVIRLKNSPAADMATTINTFITTQRQFDQSAPGLTSVYEEVEREVIVVPEPVTNSLVLSATPKYFDEIKNMIEQLDARPAMVAIQVLIASIELGNTNEFGIELGLQDSVLFDRSILSNPVVTSTTLPNGTTTQTVIAANNAPGFAFNDTANGLGNSGLGTALNPPAVGGQSISNFAVGRQDSNLGYGGLVLSAQSQNVSALLRALAENHRVEVLERPQITTLDNQPANVQVGQRVPTITSVNNNALTGQVNSVTYQNVGIILGVTPRISPDGMVVMQIDTEKSALESDATGIPIFTSPTGQVIRSPIIDSTVAQTTVSAMDGQTIVLSGLITKNKNESHRSVPWLGDIPVLGNLFRYDTTSNDRTELLIIMTPHIIRKPADAEALKREEAARMSWCLCDITKLYGEAGLRARTDAWGGGDVKVFYPDGTDQPQPLPGEPGQPETLPAPSGEPRNLLPQPDNMPIAPGPTGPDLNSPGNSTSGMRPFESPPIDPNQQQSPPPLHPPVVVEPATYQQQAVQRGAMPPAGYSQPAVYQQPEPPAYPSMIR